MRHMDIVILDESESAHQSEDFAPSRYAFLVEATTCICKAFNAYADGGAAAATRGDGLVCSSSADEDGGDGDSDRSGAPPRGLFAVIGAAARARLLIPPTHDATALHALRDAPTPAPGCTQPLALAHALKLALLTARQPRTGADGSGTGTPASGQPPDVRVVLLLASAAALSSADVQQLGGAFAAQRVGLDIVVLGGARSDEQCAATSGPPTLEALVECINSGVAAACRGDTAVPPHARLVYIPPPDDPDNAPPLWCQLEPLLELVEVDHECDSDDDDDDDDRAGQVDGGRDGTPLGVSRLRRRSVDGSSLRSAGMPPPRAVRHSKPLGSARPRATAGARGHDGGMDSLRKGLIRGRNHQPSNCRDESLDCLQHLSGDGFQRPWLPSYANIGKAVSGEGKPGDAAAASGDAAKYCFLSVYRVVQPRFFAPLTVPAGRVVPMDAHARSQAVASTHAPGACATAAAAPSDAEHARPAVPPPPWADVVTTTSDCTGPSAPDCHSGSSDDGSGSRTRSHVDETTRVNDATTPRRHDDRGHATSTSDARSVDTSGSGNAEEGGVLRSVARMEELLSGVHDASISGLMSALADLTSSDVTPARTTATAASSESARVMVAPDARAGRLRLAVSTHDASVVKLLWSATQPRVPLSLFDMAERAAAAGPRDGGGGDGDRPGVGGAASCAELADSDDDVDAELADSEDDAGGSGGGSGCARRRGVGAAEVVLTLSPTRTRFTALPGTGNRVLEVRCVTASQTRSGGSSGAPARQLLDSAGRPRFLFWVDASYTGRGGGRGASALADDLQALLECPPDAPDPKSDASAKRRGAPMQLGPLPRAMLEDLVKSVGRQLLPDGRIAPIDGGGGGGAAGAGDAWDAPAAAAAPNERDQEQQAWRQQQQEQWRRQRRRPPPAVPGDMRTPPMRPPRGGEASSPLPMPGAMLSHPLYDLDDHIEPGPRAREGPADSRASEAGNGTGGHVLSPILSFSEASQAPRGDPGDAGATAHRGGDGVAALAVATSSTGRDASSNDKDSLLFDLD